MTNTLTKRVLQPALISALLLTAGTFQVHAEDWFVGVDGFSADANTTGKDSGAGFTIGYQFQEPLMLEVTHREITTNNFSGNLDSAMVIWRTSADGVYAKLGAGFTFSSGDLFTGRSASALLGLGYRMDNAWSFELDVIRASDDVDVFSVSTQYHF